LLLATKFHRPLTVGRLTARPRLDGRLDESLAAGCPLVLVTAPAGFGKSTLVSAWLSRIEKREVSIEKADQRADHSTFSTLHSQFKTAWLSLDSGDNDPGQFLSYLVGALQRIDSALGASQVSRIQTAGVADSEAVYADVLKLLVNEIAAQPAPFILVLDDCHLLKAQPVLRLLTFLVEHQPMQLRLIVLSRENLPLPVSRLRVRRHLVELRQADLQFSLTEAEDFLREGMGIRQLTDRDILVLEQRTEGWIAGLQLAGLSIQSETDTARFIRAFTGSDRYILDYFLEEVFARQPAEIQQFLLASSLLDRFCAPLCDAVVGVLADVPPETAPGSQALLERLEHANLFLIPLDTQRRWYRYHHLFADLLRHALAQAAPQAIPALHLRASQWLEANDSIPEAARHAFQTQDWAYAAQLVERHAWRMILHSQVSIVSDWCRTFPEAVISTSPALCVFHAWALIIAFKKDDFPAATIRIEQAQAALSAIDPAAQIRLLPGAPLVNLLAWVTGHLTLLRSFILMASSRPQADPHALSDLGQLAYQQFPPEDVTGRSVGLLDMSYASQALSNAAEAEKRFEEAMQVALRGGNYFGAVVAEYHRAHGLFAQGQLRKVLAFCQQKKQTYAGYFAQPLQELPAIALLDQAMGYALLELGELEQAEAFLRSGLEVGQWMPREELPGYLALARLCALKGDAAGMEATWRRLDMRWPDIRYCTDALRTLYRLMAHPDEPEARQAAARWAAANPPAIGPGIVIPGIGPVFFDEADHAVFVAWVKIQLMLSQPDAARTVIAPMLAVAQEHQLIHRVVELSLLEAQALYLQGPETRAWEPLRLALAHAEANGYVRLVDQHPLLPRLLHAALASGLAPSYIRRLLDISPHPAPPLPAPAALPPTPVADGLLEPLSNREQEVLALIAAGLSNAEIAARLCLSPHTLKAHTQNIYGKLNVHSRVQAVNRARELNLL
jgi:LuxR family maltose regulon positive regulatory protein